jgi:hypothetical protein
VDKHLICPVFAGRIGGQTEAKDLIAIFSGPPDDYEPLAEAAHV